MPEILEFINPIIQITLASVGLWYTIETRKLRLLSEVQSKTAQGQKRLSVAPYLIVGLSDPSKIPEEADEETMEMYSSFLKELEEARKRDELLYFTTIHNPTDKVAIQVETYIYDKDKKSFLTSDSGHEALTAKESETLTISKPYMTESEAFSEVERTFSLGHQFKKSFSEKPEGWSVAYIFYKDIEGFPYLIERPFRYSEEKETEYKSQKFYFNNN